MSGSLCRPTTYNDLVSVFIITLSVRGSDVYICVHYVRIRDQWFVRERCVNRV